MSNCLSKIRSFYGKLSDKEKKIATYILDNPDKIIHSTIGDVADDLHLADATVFRFCKRLGFKGYQAMKIALASEIMAPIRQIHEEINEDDSEKAVAEKIFRSNIQTLENTLHILDGEAFRTAVRLILNARRLELYGTGGSAAIAMDACHKFLRSGIQAFVFADSHFQLISASQLTEQDVALVISHSGTNKDTIRVLNAARESGAKTIGITSYPKSPVGQGVDVALFTSSEETEYRSEALSSRIGQLSLIDALFVNIMMLNKVNAKRSLEKVRNAISQTRM